MTAYMKDIYIFFFLILFLITKLIMLCLITIYSQILIQYNIYWIFSVLQCFDAVGLVAKGASGLYKTGWWGVGMVIYCLGWDADLHMAQLMTLPLTVSCFSKIQVGFSFLVPAHPGSPRQRAIKWVLLPPPKKEVMFSVRSVCLSVCLSVSPSDYSQTCERILTKFFGGVGHGSRTKWYNFGGDPDHTSDPGVQSPKSGSSGSAEVCSLWVHSCCYCCCWAFSVCSQNKKPQLLLTNPHDVILLDKGLESRKAVIERCTIR